MSFADYVPGIISGVMWGCWIVLCIYAARVFIFVVWTCEDGRRMREAMAVGYTAVAAYFTFQATKVIPNFVQRVVGEGGSIGPTTSGIFALLVICSCFIGAAFICNFSRSLWMLKNLDHAVFEPVPDWEKLSEPKGKRTFEFLTRMIAALLFIAFELQLERVAHPRAVNEVQQVAQGSLPSPSLSQAGLIACFLYLVLIIWWVSGKLIASSKMPGSLLWFFIAGLFNSVFIFFFGDESLDESRKLWLLIVVVFMGIGAGYMIYYVIRDVLHVVWEVVKLVADLLKRRPPAAAAKVGN